MRNYIQNTPFFITRDFPTIIPFLLVCVSIHLTPFSLLFAGQCPLSLLLYFTFLWLRHFSFLLSLLFSFIFLLFSSKFSLCFSFLLLYISFYFNYFHRRFSDYFMDFTSNSIPTLLFSRLFTPRLL